MHLKWRTSEKVHGALPGSDETLCGRPVDGSSLTTKPVTCEDCLQRARATEAAVASILGKLGGS